MEFDLSTQEGMAAFKEKYDMNTPEGMAALRDYEAEKDAENTQKQAQMATMQKSFDNALKEAHAQGEFYATTEKYWRIMKSHGVEVPEHFRKTFPNLGNI